MWLPILDITGELLNLAAEIEALDITCDHRKVRDKLVDFQHADRDRRPDHRHGESGDQTNTQSC